MRERSALFFVCIHYLFIKKMPKITKAAELYLYVAPSRDSAAWAYYTPSLPVTSLFLQGSLADKVNYSDPQAGQGSVGWSG